MTTIEVTPFSLTVQVGAELNLFGWNLMVTDIKGWHGGGSAVRRDGQERSGAHGQFKERGWRDARLVTVEGQAWASSRSEAAQLADDLAAFLADGNIGQLTVVDPDQGTRWTDCYLFGTPDVVWDVPDQMGFAFELVCPDPRKYGLPVSAVTGVPKEGGGLVYDLYTGAPFTEAARNLATNPSFETASGTVEVRRNELKNPGAEVALTGWASGFGTTELSRDTTVSRTGVASFRGGGTTSDGNKVLTVTEDAVAGPVYTLSGYLRHDSAVDRSIRVDYDFLDSAGARIGAYMAGVSVSKPANGFNRVSITTVAAPTGTTKIRALFVGLTMLIAETLWVDDALIEKSSTLAEYFDGSAAAAGDFAYAWTGTAHASASVQQAPGVATGPSRTGVVNYQSQTQGVVSGAKSVAVRALGVSNDTAVALGGDDGSFAFGMTAGKTYTIAATITTPVALTGTLYGGHERRIVAFYQKPDLTHIQVTSAAGPQTGTARVSLTISIPADAIAAFFRLYNGSATYGETVYWDDLVVAEGTYTGPYYDGNTPPADDRIYQWAGTPHASASIQSTPDGDAGILDYGNAGDSGTVSFVNAGTADSAAVLRVDGYAPGFTITELGTGNRLVYTGTIPTGSHVSLDPRDGSVLLDGTADRSTALAVREWTRTPAKGTSVFLFESAGPNAKLTVEGVPAWW